jgi:uncharacterized protein
VAHPHEDLMREGFEAFRRGDIDALQQQFFAEDIRWHFAGRSQIAGEYYGVAQVVAWLGRIFELSEGTVSLEVHDLIANDDHAVALLTIRAEHAGRQLVQNCTQVFHVRDGRATESWIYPADQYANDEFWS